MLMLKINRVNRADRIYRGVTVLIFSGDLEFEN